MLQALRVIVRNGSLVLFVVLQIVCFYWIVNYNKAQNQIYFYSSHKYASYVSRRYKDFTEYFKLRKTNREAALENAELLKRLLAASSMPTDSVRLDSTLSLYQVVSANVINNSVSKRNNMITLDKGSEDGITPGMGVVSTRGLVGIVTDVSTHFALVMSLLHTKSRISCSLPNSRFFGTLVWNGQDPGKLQLEDIQRYAHVNKGDSVVTCGYSIVFPRNILVGKISDFHVEAGSFTYSIEVEPTQDFFDLSRVFVINHHLKEEKSALEKKASEYE